MSEMVCDTLRVLVVLVGAVVGAGLASGAEAEAFFAVYGLYGLLSAVLVGALMTLGVVRLLFLFHRVEEQGALLTLLFGRAARLAGMASFVFYFASLATMLAGAGEVARFWALPHRVCMFFLCLFLTCLAIRGCLLRVNLLITPCVLSLLVGASVYSLFYHSEVLMTLCVSLPSPPSWSAPLVSALSYLSYNLLLLLPVLETLRRMPNRAIVFGALLAGVVLALLLVLLVLVVLVHTCDSPMVMLAVTQMQHDVCFYAYTVILLFALITSALSALIGASSYLPMRLGRYRTPLIALLCCLCAQVGFGMLTHAVMPALGMIAAIFTARLFLPVRGGSPRR